MSVLAGTSVLREFLDFMGQRAQALSSEARPDVAPDALRHEVDSLVALGLAAYEELGDLTREAAAATPTGISDAALSGVREAHAKYLESCQPVLRLIEHARRAGVAPRRLERFMGTVGEADLIANRYERLTSSEGQADSNSTRGMAEIRDGLRRRVHGQG